MIRFDRPAFRSWFLAGVLALLSIVFALPGSAAAGRDGRADDGVPAEPTGLGIGVQPGALEVGVSWDDVPGATSYSLSWRRPGGGFQPGDAVIATDTEATLAVPDHGLWRVRLQACNDAGCGPGRAREVALVQEPIVTGASDPATGSTLTLTGACTDVTVTVLASEAGYTSMFLHFDMSDMSMATDLMITNRQVGSTMVLRGLSAGELVLGIRVQETGDVFRTGPASRNPDGLIHARISGSTVSFEDFSGGGDEDFNDAVLLVTWASCGGSPPTPPPPPRPPPRPPPPPAASSGEHPVLRRLRRLLRLLRLLRHHHHHRRRRRRRRLLWGTPSRTTRETRRRTPTTAIPRRTPTKGPLPRRTKASGQAPTAAGQASCPFPRRADGATASRTRPTWWR